MNTPLTPEQIAHNKALYEKFEKEHKLVIANGKYFFLSKYIDDKGDTITEWATKQSKDAEWADRKIRSVTVKFGIPMEVMLSMTDIMLEGEEIIYHIPPAKRWKNVIFKPNVSTSVGYNLWLGFPVHGIKGDISPFIDFMRKLIGEIVTVDHILDWFADMFQNPHLKPDWAVVLRGDKGAGKNTIEEMLGRGLLDRSNYFRTSDTTKLFGRFNGHLATNLLLVGQEIVWGGKKEMDSTLKEMITEKTRSLEKKGIDPITIDNYTRIFLTSNADWVVPASGKDERRYMVVNVKKSDDVDFNKLWKWYNNRGREALMYEMLHRDLSKFNRHKAPRTKALEEQLIHSLTGVERFAYDAIVEGEFGLRLDKKPFNVIDSSYRCKATTLFKMYTSENKSDRINQKKFGTSVKALLGVKHTPRIEGVTGYQLPPIADAAAAFEKLTGIVIDVDPDHEWKAA